MLVRLIIGGGFVVVAVAAKCVEVYSVRRGFVDGAWRYTILWGLSLGAAMSIILGGLQ